MDKQRIFLLPAIAGVLLLVLVALGIRHSPAGWWVAMCAMLAAAGWAAFEAHRSWLERRQHAGRSRSRYLLDCSRYCLALTSAIGMIALGIVHRAKANLNIAILLFGIPCAVFYVGTLVLQVRIGSRRAARIRRM